MIRTTSRGRDQITEEAADAAIEQACRILRLPTIRDRFGDQAAAAARQQATHKSFLSELLRPTWAGSPGFAAWLGTGHGLTQQRCGFHKLEVGMSAVTFLLPAKERSHG